MKIKRNTVCTSLVSAIVALLFASSAYAVDYGLAGWTSAAHFGFSIEDDSSTGFEESSGSMFILDLTRPASDFVDLGIRTSGCGGKKEIGEFYRLGTGPLASFKLSDTWSVQLAWAMFNETALSADGTKAYDSKGNSLMFGWERVHTISKAVDVAWGGFISRHQGQVSLISGINSTSAKGFSSVEQNNGTSRGVEIAVRMKL